MEHIQVYNPIGGQPYGTAPTPKNSDGTINVSDSSNKIATTEWVKSSIAGKNVGDEWHSFTGKIPPGGVPYCGQEVTRATYSDLWDYVQNNNLVKTESEWQSLNTSQNGNVPFYSDGNGNTTFRMPKIVGYIKGASSTNGVGLYTSEGLPNIEGKFGWWKGIEQAYASGAILLDKNVSVTDASHQNQTLPATNEFSFDASRSSVIYGKSSHVTPETITMLFGVYAYGELTITGSTTTDALASSVASVESGLSNKLDNDVPHVIEAWKAASGTEWYRKYSDGWIEQGGINIIDTTPTVVTLHVPFPLTKYNIVSMTSQGYCIIKEKKMASFKISATVQTSSDWIAFGY